jgi:AI-2 transport protein TqsA
MEIHKEMFLIRNLLLLLVAIAALFIMKSLAGIMLPLVFALLLSILFLPLIMFLEKKHFPKGLGVALIVIITLGIIMVVANVFISTINDIINQQDFLINQLNNKFLAIAALLGEIPYLDIDASVMLDGLNNLLNKTMLTTAAGGLLKGASSFGSSFLMFTLYFIFLLPGMSRYEHFIRYVGGEKNSFLEDYEKIQQNISTYMIIKTVISSVTGTITWLICSMVGLEFAFFWGFLTFILNFIPSIGSIIATLLPSLMGLILLETYNEFLLLLLLLGANQLVIGNFLDPKIMGNKLRLNTVAVLFGLVFWGVIWGIPGMLLSVPLSVTLKLMLEKSSSWSILARIMGSTDPEEKGVKESAFKKFLKSRKKKKK